MWECFMRFSCDIGSFGLGTPAITTRGMKEPEMERVAEWIDKVISNIEDTDLHAKVKEEVKEMCLKFPVPGIKV